MARWRVPTRPRRYCSRAKNCQKRPLAALREFYAAVRPIAPNPDLGPTKSLGQRSKSLHPRCRGEQFALGNISQPLAAFSFVHVVSGDKERQRLGGELMNLLPEIATCFWIDACRRLVQ